VGARRRQENPSFPHRPPAQDPTLGHGHRSPTAAQRLSRGSGGHSQNQSSANRPQKSPLRICQGSAMGGFGEGGDCSNFPLLFAHLILRANPFQPYGALASQTCPQEASAAAPPHPVFPREQRFGPQKWCMGGERVRAPPQMLPSSSPPAVWACMVSVENSH